MLGRASLTDAMPEQSKGFKYLNKFGDILKKFEKSGNYVIGTEKDSELYTDCSELVKRASDLNEHFIPYANITEMVYSSGWDKDGDFKSDFSQSVRECVKNIQKDPDSNFDGEAFICVWKSLEHFDLACAQINNIYNAPGTELNKLDDKLDEITTQVSTIEELRVKIYTDFITILGIFSAFVFGMFGGFKGITAAVELFQKNSLIGKPLMMTAVIMMSLMIVLYMFMSWLGFIVGKPLKRECYLCAQDGKNTCTHLVKHLPIRHIGFSTGIGVMFLIFFIGLVLALGDH